MTKTFEEIAKAYAGTHSSENMLNRVLIYGSSGVGKTYSLRTFRLPLFVDSFDPAGTVCLSDYVKEGKAVVVTDYEKEDWDRPTAFKLWDKNLTENIKNDIFKSVGTYVIDSATTWAQAALNVVLQSAGRSGGVPQQNDWYPQMVLLEKGLRRVLSLPCDVVFIFHEDTEKDELTGGIKRTVLTTGKLKTRLPLLFSEFYYANVKRTSSGTVYQWQTQADSTIQARSRNASIATTPVAANEPANFRELAKKWGGLLPDLPTLTTNQETKGT